MDEQLAAPHSPGLPPLECTVEALRPDRTLLAERLGVLDIRGQLGKEQLRAVDPARQL